MILMKWWNAYAQHLRGSSRRSNASSSHNSQCINFAYFRSSQSLHHLTIFLFPIIHCHISTIDIWHSNYTPPPPIKLLQRAHLTSFVTSGLCAQMAMVTVSIPQMILHMLENINSHGGNKNTGCLQSAIWVLGQTWLCYHKLLRRVIQMHKKKDFPGYCVDQHLCNFPNGFYD